MRTVVRAPRRIKRAEHPLHAWQHPHQFEIKLDQDPSGHKRLFLRKVVPSDGTCGLRRGEWIEAHSSIGLWNLINGIDKPDPTIVCGPAPKFESIEEALARGVEIKRGPSANSLDPEAQVEHRLMSELRRQWRKLKLSGKMPESKLDTLQHLIRRNRALRGLPALEPKKLSERASVVLGELRIQAIDQLAKERELASDLEGLLP